MATCKGCGAAIVWAISVNEKKVPLDEKPEHRYITEEVPHWNNGKPAGVVERVRLVKTYMPHHGTCPEVDKFRKPKGS